VSELYVRRDTRPWGDRLGTYRVILDGNQVGALGWAGTMNVPILPGLHALRVEVDRCGSSTVQFRVDEGNAAKFVCRLGHGSVFAIIHGLLAWLEPERRYSWIELERIETADTSGAG
jgi:hypothetical protein